MPASALSAPAHLSIFVHDPESGNPTVRLPLFAEVAVPRLVPKPPVNEHWREPVRAALLEIDPDAVADHAVRDRVEAATMAAIAGVLDEVSHQRMIADPQRTHDLARQVFKETLAAAQQEHFAPIPAVTLEQLLPAAVRRLAHEFELEVVPEVDDAGDVWSVPLGVLTTDHVGYCSFDLRRLPPDVQVLLAKAIEERRADPQAAPKLAVWISSYGHPGRIDALAQARFAADAIVARLMLKWNTLPPSLINMGPRALQNPSLTDWRLSPTSFAASPKMLVGENGCEELVPANLALQEFVLRQVVRLTEVPANFGIPQDLKAAYVDDYKVSWFSLGHSLGEVLYSLPLAPGENVKLAVIDWSWDSLTKRDETTKLTEEVLHQTHRDRTITETVKAGLKELQHGSSFMGGTASAAGGSAGANLEGVGLGAAVGNTWSLGGSTATSEGSRDLAAENVQRLNDSFSQASAAHREINSTVVIQARQEEQESIQTRTFANYNHSHTLTVLYYEVLRHYRVTVEWVRRRPAVLVQIPERVTNFDAATVIGNRDLLEPNLLDTSLKPAFDLLEKQETIREHQTLNGIVPSDNPLPQFWEGDIKFTLFDFAIMTPDNEMLTADKVVLWAIKRDGTPIELDYLYFGPHANEMHKGFDNSPENINSGGRFKEGSREQHIFVRPKPLADGTPQTIRWADLAGFQFEKWGDESWRMIRLGIVGFDGGGAIISLLEAPPPGGGLLEIYLELIGKEPSSQVVTFIRRPGPFPPPIWTRSPEKSLSPEEWHQVKKLINHFARRKDYYNRVLLMGTDPTSIAVDMESKPWGVGPSMADHVDPTPLEVFGSYVAYGLAKQIVAVDDTIVVDIAAALNGNDPARRQWALDRLAGMSDLDRQTVLERLPLASAKSERLNTMATRGVFAEGKLGHCNISEEIDNTRFWKWEEHPIPIEASKIAPVTPVQPQPQQVAAAPTPFPQSLVNIVNPAPAPDPTGLTAALSLLGTPNIFRDMSGRQEVADLLKKLSDNSIGIADAANRAREIQGKYGTDLDKQDKDFELGRMQTDAEVAKEVLRQRAAQAEKVTPSQAQDAIKLSESEKDKGNKTPDEHRQYSKQVQQNVQGAKPSRKSKQNIKFDINLKGYGNNLLVGRFGVDVKQRNTAVGFLMATDYSREGQLVVGVSNEFDDPRYQVEINGEVLGGVGINAQLRGRDVVQIPREDFDTYDYFYLLATAEVGEFDFETTKSDEIAKEVAKKIGGDVGAELAWKATITAKTEGGVEWKDGQTHTSATAVKLKIAYYKGGFTVAYVKKP